MQENPSKPPLTYCLFPRSQSRLTLLTRQNLRTCHTLPRRHEITELPMDCCAYIPFFNSYSPANYVHEIKLNRGDPSNLCLPHISSALLFVVDDVHWDVLGCRCWCATRSYHPKRIIEQICNIRPARVNLFLNCRLDRFGGTGTAKFGMETRGRCLTESLGRARFSQSRTYHSTPYSLK